MNVLRRILQVLLPLAVLALGAALAARIANRPKQPQVAAPAAVGPLVRTAMAERTDLQLDVETQGTVEPFRTVAVGAEVAGRVVATHPELRPGGLVAKGEVLVELDPSDLELTVAQREAAVARAELGLLQERAEADAAVRAWRELEGERAAEPLVSRQPQIADAEKALAAARAALAQSRLDLARARITAPVAGRVRSAEVDLGQVVRPGQALAVLFDLAAVEVRLPLPVADAAFVDLPLAGSATDGSGPTVVVTADFAGRRHQWSGRIVRVEAELDRRSRQLTAVARVDEPFAASGDRPPLLVGMFVQARIQGHRLDDVVVVPRAALRGGDHVWVVDAERRLRRREVEVLRAERDRIVLRRGVEAGEIVCLSQLEAVTDGMPVRLTADDLPPAVHQLAPR
ncbi:MAG: efflux RND transporter periplasmic adaptor subunit [Planctomycetes bacterium]|nr:efflux RND transporter periplasmic adaptor subunit [Planctomycetota bacterium]